MNSSAKKSRGLFWMMLPVLLLGGAGLGWIVMIRLALDDPGFSLEPDYYKKAVEFDARAAKKRASEAADIALSIARFERVGEKTRIELRVTDREGRPIEAHEVRAKALANARANQLFPLAFHALGGGVFEAESTTMSRPGLWEFEFELTTREGKFERILRADLTPSGVRT